MNKLIAALFLLSTGAFAQNCGLAPTGLVYLDANGVPLSGGFIATYASGTTTPATAYSDSSCTTALSNPVQLNSSGQPYAGSGNLTGVWLSTTLLYRFVVLNSSMVAQWTLDGITGTGTTSASTNYWQLSGTTISSTNGAGTGNVFTGGSFGAAGTGQFGLGIILNDTQPTPNTITIRAPNCEGTLVGSTCTGLSYTWRWPSVDLASGVLTSDGAGNLSFQPGGGGGGGSAVGPTGAVQLQAGGGSFTGSGNLTYISQLLTATATASTNAAIAAGTGFIQSDAGFYATTGVCLSWQCVNIPTGGIYAQSIYGLNYTTTGSSSGAPSPTTGQPAFSSSNGLGTLYCDTGSSPCVEKLWNGSAWVTLASGGATSPGGSNCDVQTNVAGSFGGSNNFTWNCAATPQEVVVTAASTASPGLTVSVGYGQFDAGVYVTTGVSPSWQNINVPTGGVYARSAYFNGYIVTGSSNGAPGSGGSAVSLTSGQPAFSGTAGLGGLYCDSSTTPCVEKYWNGSAWLALSGGGGGGAPCGPANSIQYNAAGICGGGTTFTFNGTNTVNIAGQLTISGSGSINTANQFVGAAVNVAGVVESQVATSAAAFQTSNNLFSATGTGIITAVGYQGGSSGIYTTSAVANSIQTAGGFNADDTGGTSAAFSVDGTAVIDNARNITGLVIEAQTGFNSLGTAYNSVQTAGGFNADDLGGTNPVLSVRGFTIIDGNANASFGGTLGVTGVTTLSSALNANGGLVTPSSTNSTLYIGTGQLYIHVVSGASTGISCSGVTNGYLAITTSDNYIVVCDNSGTRYRAALTAF